MVDQFSVVLSPFVIVIGDAVNESTNWITVTVTVLVTPRPAAALPVSVKVVVAFTVTVVEPSTGTVPTPGDMLTEEILEVDQLRVTVPDPYTDEGDAVKECIVGNWAAAESGKSSRMQTEATVIVQAEVDMVKCS